MVHTSRKTDRQNVEGKETLQIDELSVKQMTDVQKRTDRQNDELKDILTDRLSDRHTDRMTNGKIY